MIVDRSSRGRGPAARRRGGRVPPGPGHERRRGRSAPGQGCYAALLNHKGKMRLDMRILRGPDWIWIDTEPGADAVLLKTIETYSLGRDVTLGVRRRGDRLADRRARPRRRAARGGARLGRGRARDLRPHLRGRRHDRPRPPGGRRPRGRGRVRADRGRYPPLRPRHGRRHDPPGGRHQRARRLVHQGLLRRPGDGRAPLLQGKAEPPPARPEAEPARPSTGRRSRSASARWAGSGPPACPPPTARSPWLWSGERPHRGTRVDVDGAAAEVVELPFR